MRGIPIAPELIYNSLAEYSILNTFLENYQMAKSSEANPELVNQTHGFNMAYEQRSSDQGPMCDRNRSQIMEWKVHAQTVIILPKERKGKRKIPKNGHVACLMMSFKIG